VSLLFSWSHLSMFCLPALASYLDMEAYALAWPDQSLLTRWILIAACLQAGHAKVPGSFSRPRLALHAKE
jgi:hypothetical protein